ncbi:MAG: hypothetical protein WBP03_02115 [Candidatus Saccharimonadales bacterium]|jgi:hypothetical protein
MGITQFVYYISGNVAVDPSVKLDVSTLPNNSETDIAKSTVPVLVNMVFAVTASVTLLIIIISGLRYILAGGDANKMSTAKNGIIYGLVGLAITLSAYSIVFLVLRSLG